MNRPDQPAGRHPIGVVAERTGLTTDVLRVWERRYGAVHPDRTGGRQRFYSDADIERLRLLRLATLRGRSISQVAHLTSAALARMVEEDALGRARAGARGSDVTHAAGEYVDQALDLVRGLDALGLEWLLRRTSAVLGLRPFLESIAAPLMRRVGDEWHAGRLTAAQEHLATAMVRRVVTGITQTMGVAADAPRVVVATMAGERHEIGALLAAATATAEGWRVTYLGSDLPAKDIAEAALATAARAVAVSVVYPADRRQVMRELKEIRDLLPAAVRILVGGAGAAAISHDLTLAGVRVVDGLTDLAVVLAT
ncbi:MAG: MerR family transcriptional regulator [Gemmatimonadaceae bacterium]